MSPAHFDQLPPEYRALLQLAKERYQLDVTPLDELRGGRTGAYLYLVSAAIGDTQHVRHFIVKFDHVHETGRQTEKERHMQALRQAPENFASQHMASLAYEIEQAGAVALFYTIAGQSLQQFRPLASQEQQIHLERLFGVTNEYILEQWNAAAVFAQATPPQTLLTKWLGYRLKADGPISAFIKDIFHLDPETEGFLIQGQVYPNPFRYGLDAACWLNARPIDVLTGFQHGDLNIANILVRFAEDTAEVEGYFLIDFALYKAGMPLLYDQRYLEMSYLIRELGRTSFQKWISLVAQFSVRDMPNPKEVPVELAGTCEVINAGTRSFQRWVNTWHASVSDDLWGQSWLAAVAAGLNFCNKSALSREEKLAGLIYASVHLKRYLNQFGVPLPVDVRLLYDASRPEPPSTLKPTAVPASAVPDHNLPTQLTSFIGRKKEVADIKGLLESARLVTLTGAGGSGKTRLTIEVGLDQLAAYPDGVRIIELAPLTDQVQIMPAIAQIFGLQELPFMSIESIVIDYLRLKKSLLILDNCEHLIEACAHLAAELLQQCAQLKLLASSREALNIAGEVTYQTPTLASAEATRLFEERARAANPKFTLSEANAFSVAQICSRLDGIPLAIELAAARTKMLSPDQIATRLDDRFRLLVGGNRAALPRQQTLRALIDWSYDLLSDKEKQLLQITSVFVGGWNLEILEAVAEDSDVIEQLEELINKSLVITEERPSQMRYFMLETIRQYAGEKLKETGRATEVCDRHFFYYDGLAEKMWQAFFSSDLLAWRDTFDDEAENLRAAVEWGMQNHPDVALHTAASYCLVSSLTGQQANGLGLLLSALDRFRLLPPVEGAAHLERQRSLVKALFAQALIGVTSAAVSIGLQAVEEAISIARQIDDKQMLGYCLELRYTGTAFVSASSAAEDGAREGYAILLDIHDTWGLSWAYANMTRIALTKNELAEAQTYVDKLNIITQTVPLSYQTGIAFLSIGSQERWAHLDNAREYYEQALRIFRHLRHKSFETVLMSELGHVARASGNIAEAKHVYQQTILRFQDQGHRPAIAHQLECFAFLAIAEQQPQRATVILGAAQTLRERIQAEMQDMEEVEYQNALLRLHFLLSEKEFNSLWAEGRAMTMEQAIQFAVE